MTVTVSTNSSQYPPGAVVSISGNVLAGQSPVFGAAVSLQVNDPNNTPAHIQLLYSDQSGHYTDSFVLSPNAPQGQYNIYVSASKSGYISTQTQTQFQVIAQTATTTTQTSTSTTSTNPPGRSCVIATATYGSELAPEVALLREFRDAHVLKTAAGAAFMQVFNTFYYSFSPQAAALIASQEDLRTGMRFALYPLVGILSTSKDFFQFLSANHEAAVVVSGIFASFSLGVIYAGPVVFLACFLNRHEKRIRATMRFIGLGCAASVVFLVMAELPQLNLLLPAITASTVLFFFTLGAVLPSILMWTRGGISARLG